MACTSQRECIFMCVYAHVSEQVCVCVYVHVSIRGWVYVWMYSRVIGHSGVDASLPVHVFCPSAHTSSHLFLFTQKYSTMNIYICQNAQSLKWQHLKTGLIHV